MKVTIIGGGPGGLYFALLAKKAWPRWEVSVHERNRPDDTFGFGVVFSDQTLDTFKAYDLVTYERIRRRFAYWGDVDVVYKGRVMRSGGNGFCGCSRVVLLNILQDRGRELGVQMRFQREVEGLEEFSDSDLIVVADGINSRIREKYKDHFQPSVDLRSNKFTWLGSTRALDAFKYFFRETPEGVLLAHCYQYEPQRSTWVIEMNQDTWLNFGFDKLSETEMLPVLERVFAEELDGHPLIANRSLWRNFPNITNRTWVKTDGNMSAVLIGDAKATAHFSIGSGTKLAMEDAIALFEAFRSHPEAKQALTVYDTARREEVEKTQHAANVSLAWFEHMKRYWTMEPPQFAFGVMSRSKQITWENLELRDPAFIQEIHRWFAQRVRAQGFDINLDDPPVPMFTPFRLRDMVVENRVVVSPMDQYSAVDGVPGDWHFVHLGSRAVGGAGLVYVEMTCPSPEARISPGDTGLWNETQRDAFKRIVQFCRAHSRARMCMQLGHSGRKGSTQLGWERMDHPLESGNWPVISASVLRRYLAGAARSDAGRFEAHHRRIREINPLRGRSRLRHARAAHGARLPSRQLHFAAHQPADRFLWWEDRESHALPAGGVPRLPRGVAGRQAHVGAHLGHRLGAGRALGRGPDRADADAQARGLRSHRLLDRADGAAPAAGIRTDVPGALRRLGAKRGRHRHDDGRRRDHPRPGEHAARGRQSGPRGARAAAPRQSVFHAPGFRVVSAPAAILAAAVSSGS
jgi:anthraniloyl-CoA monooxygenase